MSIDLRPALVSAFAIFGAVACGSSDSAAPAQTTSDAGGGAGASAGGSSGGTAGMSASVGGNGGAAQAGKGGSSAAGSAGAAGVAGHAGGASGGEAGAGAGGVATGGNAGSNSASGAGGTGGDMGAGGDAGSSGSGGSAGDGGAAGAGGAAGDGPILPILGCADMVDAVYVTPSGLSPFTPAVRGQIVHCAPDVTLTQSAVQMELMGKSLNDVIATTSLRIYRIAFRTERADDVPGVSTARVYLPDIPHSASLPLIVIGHPSNGLADSCAPSKDETSMQDLALPWAARGYAVIAADYAGLGNEGTQGYLDNHDQAHSMLDSARALRKLIDPSFVSSQIVMFGHSQGGGAALSAQALAGAYGADGDVTAVAVFAPEWPTRLNSFGFVNILKSPASLTIIGGITNPVILQSLSLAYARDYSVDPATLFPAAKAAGVANAADTLCLTEFGGYVQGAALHLGDLTDVGMRTAYLACVADSTDPACTGAGQALFQFMSNNFLKGDPAGAKIRYVQGLLDPIMPPGAEAACNIAKLQADGVTPQVCTDQTGIHTNVVVNNIVSAMAWAEAVVAGEAEPTCDSSGMPACSP